MTKPITPKEARKTARKDLPDGVLEAFNELIVKYLNGRRASFGFSEAAALIASKLDIKPKEVYEKHYLHVEEEYRKAGWTVVEDKPAYDESYEGYWTFTAPATNGES